MHKEVTKVYFSKNKILFNLLTQIIMGFALCLSYYLIKYKIIWLVLGLLYLIIMSYIDIKHFKLWKKKTPIIILDKEYIQIFRRGKYDIHNWTDFIKLKNLRTFSPKFRNYYDYSIYVKRKEQKKVNNQSLLEKFYQFIDTPFINYFTKNKIMIYYFVDLECDYETLSEICENYKNQKNR